MYWLPDSGVCAIYIAGPEEPAAGAAPSPVRIGAAAGLATTWAAGWRSVPSEAVHWCRRSHLGSIASISSVDQECLPDTPHSDCHARHDDACSCSSNSRLLLLGLPMRRSRLQWRNRVHEAVRTHRTPTHRTDVERNVCSRRINLARPARRQLSPDVTQAEWRHGRC